MTIGAYKGSTVLREHHNWENKWSSCVVDLKFFANIRKKNSKRFCEGITDTNVHKMTPFYSDKNNLTMKLFEKIIFINYLIQHLIAGNESLNQLRRIAIYKNLGKQSIWGNLVKIFSFPEKNNLELWIVRLCVPKSRVLRFQIQSQKNDSYSAYAEMGI